MVGQQRGTHLDAFEEAHGKEVRISGRAPGAGGTRELNFLDLEMFRPDFTVDSHVLEEV